MTITVSAYRFISELVRRETAMILGPGKEYLVEARLLPLARESGLDTVSEYIDELRTRRPSSQRDAINALTINETSWFRDNEPFKALVSHVLPQLREARSREMHLRVWSAACSSGQEPYSLAILLSDHLPAGWTAEILATDVSTAMLERTRAGRYSQLEVNRGMPAPTLVKHFVRAGSDWEISAPLRKMVRVQLMNLAAPFPELPSFDLVLLRNVLIYFDVETKRNILHKVRRVMADDGHLVLGAAETTLGLDDTWVQTPMGPIRTIRPGGGPTSPRAPGLTPAAAPLRAAHERS